LTKLLPLAIFFSLVALAADIGGKWIAQIPGRDGQTREVVYQFRVDGDKLTGTMTGPQGADIAISDGRIDGSL